MINPIAIAINRGTNRKQVPNIIGSSNSNVKKSLRVSRKSLISFERPY